MLSVVYQQAIQFECNARRQIGSQIRLLLVEGASYKRWGNQIASLQILLSQNPNGTA